MSEQESGCTSPCLGFAASLLTLVAGRTSGESLQEHDGPCAGGFCLCPFSCFWSWLGVHEPPDTPQHPKGQTRSSGQDTAPPLSKEEPCVRGRASGGF